MINYVLYDGLKECIRKKIKDKDFLIILDEIIDSTDSVRNTSSKLTGKNGIGVPIGLKVKDNYQIYPVDSRGINFVGYVKNRKENVKLQT